MGGKKSEVRIIKDHLLTLGLEERRPSFTEVRKAFRVKVLEHPDKGGSTAAFQEVTRAVREVLNWLSERPSTATMEEEEGDRELLKVFESSSGVTYNETCVTFTLEEEKVEVWRSALREYFEGEETSEKEGDHGVQFKHPMWPLVGQEGEVRRDTLSVTLYHSCKVLVQGKLYLHFVTQVLPRMALSLGKDKAQVKAILGGEEKEKVEEKEEETPVEKEKGDKKCEDSDMNTVNDSIKRLEKAFIEKLEASNEYQVASQAELKEVKAVLKALKEEVNTLKESDPKVPQPIGSVQSLSTKIEASAQEIKSKIEEVQQNVEKVVGITTETASDVKKISSSYEDIKKVMSEAHSKLDIIHQSLTRSSRLVGGQPPASPTKVQEEEVVATLEEEVVEVKQRKGIIFTSSLARELDIKQFEKETNSKVEKIETYRIKEKKVGCKNPESFVTGMVKAHMKKDYDFAVFVVGTNDITDLKESLESTDVLENCEQLSQQLVDAMVGVATEFDTEVFVSELAPRYDSPEKDGLGPLATLSMVTNTLMVAKVKEAKTRSIRLHLVNQRSLARPRGVEQNKVYKKDGKHLTVEGLSLLSSNLTSALRLVYKDLPKVHVEEVKVKEQAAPKVKPLQKGTPLPPQGTPLPPQGTPRPPQGTPRPPQGTPRPPLGANRPPGGQFQPWVGQSLPPRLPPRHLLPPREQVAPPHQWDPREPQYPAPQGHLGALYPAPQGGPRPLGPDYPYYGPPPPARRLGHHYTPQYYDYDGGYF